MPRKLRIQYPGAIYHVINRGDRREDIFKGGADRKLFLATLTGRKPMKKRPGEWYRQDCGSWDGSGRNCLRGPKAIRLR